MGKPAYLLLLLLASSFVATLGEDPCTNGGQDVISESNYCYEVKYDRVLIWNYTSARDTCKKHGSLASVHSQEHFDALTNGLEGEVWIGLIKWVDGEKILQVFLTTPLDSHVAIQEIGSGLIIHLLISTQSKSVVLVNVLELMDRLVSGSTITVPPFSMDTFVNTEKVKRDTKYEQS